MKKQKNRETGQLASPRLEDFFKTQTSYRGMPMVRTTDGYLVTWNKKRIVEQLLEETQLAEKMFGIPRLASAMPRRSLTKSSIG